MAFILHPDDPQSFYVPVHMSMRGDKPGPIHFPTWLNDVGETEVVDRASDAWFDQLDRWMAHSYAKRLLERPEIEWLDESGHHFNTYIWDAISGPRARHFRITIPDKRAAIHFALNCDDEMMPDAT